MDLRVETVDDVTVVEFAFAELDASNAEALKRELAPLLDTRTRVVFDLATLVFVDSSGLGALLSCLRRVNTRGGDLKLCNLSKPVAAVFELVRMHRVFDILPARDAAIHAFVPAAAAS